jgi:hypothetical protein
MLASATHERGHIVSELTADKRTEGQDDVGHRVHQHDKNTRPQKPVSGRRPSDIELGIREGHGNIANKRVLGTGRAAESESILHERRCNCRHSN